MECAGHHCIETPMMDFDGNSVDADEVNDKSRWSVQPVSIAAACNECSRLFEPTSSSLMKCDDCWKAGLAAGSIKTGMRKYKRMRVSPQGKIVFECDFC